MLNTYHRDHDFRSPLPRPPLPSMAIGVRYLIGKLMNSIIDLSWGYFSMIRKVNKIFGAELIQPLRRITIDVADIGPTTSIKIGI